MEKKKFFLGAAVVMSVVGLAACSRQLKGAQERMSEVGLNAIKTSEVAKATTDANVEKYKFLGANISSYADYYDVEVCGVTTTSDKAEKAYATMYYTVPISQFDSVKKQDTPSVINSLADVVETQEMTAYSYVPVKDFNALNSAVKSVLESPIDEFRPNKTLVYGVNNLNFNYEDGYASFTTYEDTKYSRTRTELVWTIVGFDLEGNAEYGYTMQTVTDYEDFVQEHNMYVKATSEELDAMKEDNTLVFDKYIAAVNSGDKSLYTVQSVNVQKETEFNTNLLGKEDFSL